MSAPCDIGDIKVFQKYYFHILNDFDFNLD